MRHLSENVHETLGKFSKYFPDFHIKINDRPVKIRDSDMKGVTTSRGAISQRARVESKVIPN